LTDLRYDTDRTPHADQVRQPPVRAGKVIAARYRLEAVAGAGGMATVWRAYDERLRRPVAIKVISDALATNPVAVARFAREARTHARIQHPNLVQVYDYSVTASQPYLVMEYIDGSTLSERLDQGGFSGAEIHALAVELLSAIACVHNHGVLHRDIKTGNVLLDKDGHARLTDFGLARLEDATQITRANEVVGTLRFLAPELIEGRAASRQSDLYALGVLLRTASADAAAPALQHLITWMTQPDPDDRPPDAHSVLAALRQGHRPDSLRPPAAKPRPVAPAQPTGPLSRAGRRRQLGSRELRTRTVAVSALLITVAVIALAILASAGGTTASANASGSAHIANSAHSGAGHRTATSGPGTR